MAIAKFVYTTSERLQNLSVEDGQIIFIPDMQTISPTVALSTAITTVKAKIEAEKENDYISNVKLEGVSIKDLWDKEYKLKWDYNSKK